MNPTARWRALAALGGGAFSLGLYATWQTLRYFADSEDAMGALIFGCAAFGLLLTAGAHWYMAAGFKFGRLDLVAGSMAAVTLRQGHRTVIASAKVQFVRKLDADNASLAPDDRYVFLICSYRPWVCKEVDFHVV